MEKLTIEQSRNVVGGKGITGALLSGVGSITKSVSELFANTVGSVATTVFTAISLNKSDKLESKIGNSSFKFDNSASKKAEIEAANKVPSIVNLF
ncbi:hypothetical protein [Spiroplasma diminutum]|uniref:Uncharacterized protein n=1 Tax=Spiroplasma diminutum CUAS-1 TaxID=1276221 RepID=S5LVR1_9MOLU|nr:hypothetical protein [Spiroplasma diminutum]AGR41919.1 hypothetical protein SDIMI_v3c02150 [Spiroplasma diminutum CUAS-1]